MPISRKTPLSKIQAYIETALKRKEAAIIRSLSYLGELCINVARDSDEYKDQTGNLRSSTGYIILKDGVVLKKSGFETVKNGSEGSEKGESFAQSLVSQYGSGFVLIVVAGMNYATYVEATGRDVLTSSEHLAIKEMPKILQRLKLS